MTQPLVNANKPAGKSGKIVITAEEVEATANAEIVMFNPIANMSETSLCFFIIYRNIAPGKYTPIYKSEIKRPESGGSYKFN